MATLLTNGIRTHYQLMAAQGPQRHPAPTVVFLHGLGVDSLASFYLTLAGPAAAAGIDVVTYDLRGHGRSEQPRQGYRLDDFVEDLAALLDGIGVHGPVHLVGNSFGATVAFSFAAREPQRVASIVSIESEPATAAWAGRIRAGLSEARTEFSGDLQDKLREALGERRVSAARKTLDGLYATTLFEDITESLLTPADLARITCPVLSLLGSEGLHMDDAHALSAALPDCTVEILEGLNHFVLLGGHRRIRDVVCSWILDRHQARTAVA